MQNLINNLKIKKSGGSVPKSIISTKKTRVVASSSQNDNDSNIHHHSPTSFVIL